jgi:hypothetical protein
MRRDFLRGADALRRWKNRVRRSTEMAAERARDVGRFVRSARRGGPTSSRAAKRAESGSCQSMVGQYASERGKGDDSR